MDSFLYLLSEDDNDDFFYHLCLEKLTGRTFYLDSVRLRKGGGIGEVRKKLPFLLERFRYSGSNQDIFFFLALDNDRSRQHPNHQTSLEPARIKRLPKREQNKACRYCELEREITSLLGQPWSVRGAIAIPVEMLESWLLLICDQRLREEALPIFSEQTQALCVDYFSPVPPPEQLKDLCANEMKKLAFSKKDEFYLHCVEALDAQDLASRSPSFALFLKQIEDWKVNPITP